MLGDRVAVSVGVNDGVAQIVAEATTNPSLSAFGIAVISPPPSAQNMCHRCWVPRPVTGMGADVISDAVPQVPVVVSVLVSTFPLA